MLTVPFLRGATRASNALYLLDTDWIVHYLRGKRQSIVDRILELEPYGLAVSGISLAELYHGVYTSAREQENLAGVCDFLSGVIIIPVDASIAERFGSEKAHLRNQGLVVDNFDLLIGCTALANNMTLLTNNTKHYTMIQGLMIESLSL